MKYTLKSTPVTVRQSLLVQLASRGDQSVCIQLVLDRLEPNQLTVEGLMDMSYSEYDELVAAVAENVHKNLRVRQDERVSDMGAKLREWLSDS